MKSFNSCHGVSVQDVSKAEGVAKLHSMGEVGAVVTALGQVHHDNLNFCGTHNPPHQTSPCFGGGQIPDAESAEELRQAAECKGHRFDVLMKKEKAEMFSLTLFGITFKLR